MKILITLFFILLSTVSFGAELQSDAPFSYVFAGKWVPADDPLLLGEFDFQDIQNLRRDGNRLRGVNGHTRTSPGVVNATNKFIRNGFHFRKDQPQESHVLVYARDANATTSKIYQNTTAIPNVGDFAADELHTDASGSEIGNFSKAPQGNVLYANGEESMIWGGTEFRISAFITSTAAVTNTVTNAKNRTGAIQNTGSAPGQTSTISLAADKVFLVGSVRPLQGVKIYISSANGSAANLTVKEWDGSNWSGVSSLVDNTSGLDNTNTVTWDSTVTTSRQKYLEGFVLYWYQFEISAGSAVINHLTVDAPFQTIKNIWDGSEEVVGAFQTDNGTLVNTYTDEVNTSDTTFFADLSLFPNGGNCTIGFANPQQALNLRLVGGKENTVNSVITAKYWNGSAWVAVSNQVDGTDNGGKSFGKTGVVSWSQLADGVEFTTSVGDEIPLFYYQLSFSVTLSADVNIYHVTGIESPATVTGYRIPAQFQGRAWLFSEKNNEQNKGLYSAFNQPDVYNGPDSDALFFGDETKITGAGVIYNLFNTTGLEQLIVTKQTETYRVFGNDPSSWEVQQLSGNVGNVSTRSIDVCDVSDLGRGTTRHVMFWQSHSGVIICDGATVQLASEDIKVYWDETDPRAIPTDRLDDSIGWCDKSRNSYKLLISSGTGQTTHNIELEYNIKDNSWTKIHREKSDGANPLQAGFEVVDTNGRFYSYGATDEGFVYRTENGTTWNGTPMNQFIQTKDILLSNQDRPLFKDTVIDYVRLTYETKTGNTLDFLVDESGNFLVDGAGNNIITSVGENITMTHYCDRVQTADATDNQEVPDAYDMSLGPIETKDSVLGPCSMHSIKLEADISTLTDGMELTGMGLYYDAQETISGVE